MIRVTVITFASGRVSLLMTMTFFLIREETISQLEPAGLGLSPVCQSYVLQKELFL